MLTTHLFNVTTATSVDSKRHGGHVPLPTFTNSWARGTCVKIAVISVRVHCFNAYEQVFEFIALKVDALFQVK